MSIVIKKGQFLNTDFIKNNYTVLMKDTKNYQLYKQYIDYKISLIYVDVKHTYIDCNFDSMQDVHKANQLFNDEVLKEIVKKGFEVV